MRIHLGMHKSRLIDDEGLVAEVQTVFQEGLFLLYVSDYRIGCSQERFAIAFTRANALLLAQAKLARLKFENTRAGSQRLTLGHVLQVVGGKVTQPLENRSAS